MSSEDVRREDIEGDEAWHRVTDEPDILLVEAIHKEGGRAHSRVAVHVIVASRCLMRSR